MKKSTLFTIVASLLIGILISFSFSNKYEINAEEYQSAFKDNIKVFAVSIPSKINFAGDAVPLDRFYVQEAVERELTVNTYFHSSSILLIKKANRWFPVIEPILKKHNIPEDFKYLAVAESGLDNVVSPAGATGFWQIMKQTGREYGLEINEDIDQRYDLELSTEVACQYFTKAYDKYGSWALVAASYNAGMSRISEEMERQQHDNYYDMIFGEETGRYVYRIIALKVLLENPNESGFYIRKKDLYKPFKLKKITVDTTINDIPAFAKSFELNYKEFKIYNPWIRQAYLANKSRRTYTILVP